MILGGSNSYSGGTRVAGGELLLSSASALGSSTASLTATNGSSIDLGGYGVTVGTFRIYSGSTLADGTLTANSYALNGGTVNANLGSGSITVGGSTALNAASAASSVNITNGTLSLGAVNVLANANIVVTNAGTLNLGLYSNAVSSFTLNGGTLSGTGILTSTGGYILNGGTVNGYLGAGTISISTGTTVLTSSNQLSPSLILVVREPFLSVVCSRRPPL